MTNITPATGSKSHLRGIAFYAVTVLLFASLDTMTKLLTATYHYPVPLVAWVRYTIQLLLMTAILVPSMGLEIISAKRPFPVIVRALFLVCATLFMGLALKRLPLAEAVAIVFTAPLLVVFLAGPLLGERFRFSRAALSVLGFTGVILIARPTGQLDTLGVLFALLAAVVTAAYQIMSRGLSREQPLTLLYISALVGAVAFGLLAPFSWSGDPLTLPLILLFLALGVTGGLGHFFLTLSFRYAPASLIAPVSYLQLLWSGLLGWLVFRHIPDPIALIGMAIIAASGIATIMTGRQPQPAKAVE